MPNEKGVKRKMDDGIEQAVWATSEVSYYTAVT